jgi:hypothetical protein
MNQALYAHMNNKRKIKKKKKQSKSVCSGEGDNSEDTDQAFICVSFRGHDCTAHFGVLVKDDQFVLCLGRPMTTKTLLNI